LNCSIYQKYCEKPAHQQQKQNECIKKLLFDLEEINQNRGEEEEKHNQKRKRII